MSQKFKIGILGGGQLARMMLLEGHRLGLDLYVLSQNADDPAAQVTQNWIKGDVNNFDNVLRFARCVDLLTFESEFVRPQILDQLADKEIPCSPNPQLIRKIQDRLEQKQLLEKYNVSTSAFRAIENVQQLLHEKQNIQLPLVLKARLGGYDGKGTFILKNWEDSLEDCKQFLENCRDGAIAEDFIEFNRELAISVARGPNGDLIFFPLVESFQEDCRCLWVKGPVEHPELNRLKSQLKDMLEKENYVGFISFELFETTQGLLINEIAPRVHNSVHYSQNALTVDQFSCHLMAIAGLKLSPPSLIRDGFAMYNLIGSGSNSPSWNIGSDIFLHWYGKKHNRFGRKMGHLNAVANGPDKALEKLVKARKEFQL